MKVFWTEEAKHTFTENILYLEKEWNQSVIDTFLDRTDECILLISQHPILFPVVDKRKEVHRCLVVKQVSLYYKVVKKEIHLITFWNNFQNPEKLKF